MAMLTEAVEGTSKVITMTFTDEDGLSVVPTSCVWDLRNSKGAIVNFRASVQTVVATAISIVLQAADLVWGENESYSRTLTIRAVYSSAYGSAQTVYDEATFKIRNLAGI